VATEDKAQIAVRLPGTLLARLDAYKDRIRGELPGMEFTRADAVRVLLEKALADAGMSGGSVRLAGKPRRRVS
jgi:hypothetical protein